MNPYNHPPRGHRGSRQQQQPRQQQHHQQYYDPNLDRNYFSNYDPSFGYEAGYGYGQQQQQMGYPDDCYGSQQQYGHYQQQYDAGEYADFDDADHANMDDIDRAIALEEEMRQIGELQAHVDANRADMSRVPSGAVPMRDGILSPQAAEFWFPESRDCACCNGYKHGCKCCKGTVKACQDCSTAVVNTAPLPQPPAAPRTPPTVGGALTIEAPADDEPAPVSSSVAVKSSTARVPIGMPSQGGVLSRHAAEYWFPECRDCACCKGYKHGCSCCRGGVTECTCTSGGTPPVPPTGDGGAAAVRAVARQVGGLVIESPDDESDLASSTKSTLPPGQGSCGGNGRVPIGMPSQGGVLSRHAAEYWFPECRDCACCKGYKHGCSCCNGPTVVCKCVAGSEAASYSGGPGTSSHAKSRKPCAYFASGNCRFGEACKNLH